MRRTKPLYAVASTLLLTIFSTAPSSAQLSTNPDKFLGNITTYYNVDYGNEKFYTLWNQITCENETKWSSVQGSGQSSWNWGGADNAYNYAKQHNFPFKFHTLVWGSQFPEWVKDLSAGNRYKAIVKWMDEIKKRYPDLEMIDVVNEAIEGHQADTWYIKEALGGGGQTGYDWIIKAFELAYERWPNAILIYNDFNTFQWDTNKFIDLVKTLRDSGAPIDAYGCQSHDVTGLSLDALKSSEQQIQNALKMPMYITEYDIGSKSDDDQLRDYKNQIPYLWERDYCAGITLWGYIYGATWIHERDNQGNIATRGISGLIKNGSDRSAMTWLRQYMATDAAKNAKSPFPGMKKEASVYIKPSEYIATVNKPITLTVRASMRTKTIQSVTLWTKGKYVWSDEATLTQAPFVFNYTPTKLGENLYKVVVTTTDGQTYERYGAVKANKPRVPYKSMELPGTIEAEDFDKSGEGATFHDNDSNDEGKSGYRSDNEGVDIVTGNGGYAIGYTNTGEWLEYTVNVKQSGTYDFAAVVSSGIENSSFKISLIKPEGETVLATVAVPKTGDNDWSNYTAVAGTLSKGLGTGNHIIRFTITGSSCNIDKVVFTFKSDVKYIQDADEYANGTRYNLGGQRVNEYRPGLNIINGKKVYIME
ncbi:MAG: endo-1,4-beta-xylanase [Bacteroidaceae bacterium]|nr:endo-1,4-beta-xylanase [Bacteroidaceae bacterium]